MFHIYTFGTESKQFLILTPKQAAVVNDFTDRLFDAQQEFLNENGRSWIPSEPLTMKFSKKFGPDLYNKTVTRYCNPQHTIRNKLFTLLRIDVKDEELDDYLVKRF